MVFIPDLCPSSLNILNILFDHEEKTETVGVLHKQLHGNHKARGIILTLSGNTALDDSPSQQVAPHVLKSTSTSPQSV